MALSCVARAQFCDEKNVFFCEKRFFVKDNRPNYDRLAVI